MPIALITGGGTGIGRAAGVALAGIGYTVVLAGRRPEPLESAAADISGAVARTADVSDLSSVDALFSFIAQRFGRLDLLFNNAGTGMMPSPIEDIPLADWQSVIDVNVTGAFLCTQHAFALMKRQDRPGGRIINNGSISAHVPRPLSTAYTVSKHAITGLTKSTSLEGRRYNIACGQIDIGNAATDLTQAMHTGVLQADGRVAQEPTMAVELVGQCVAQMASLPLDANVQFMTVMATAMPFIGRG
ncbi:SDR family oxidoreductase [Caenibius sp. WL]|uniref:SDR family oxidoreductase n=1 Tax=Caenibius sp. WL TaxID=2872646 RepID=UPI001C99649A|nr:SDR family oxidoreductase [Caenibius sp. WL]QZP08432.1 SDR family oxidoreductase [Caenibius sp. WL]